jgi:uncharacterized protein (TIGR03435 family)
MLARLTALAICLSITLPARAQSFDVASIKPAAISKSGGDGNSSRSQIQYSADTLILLNIDLNELIQWAYKLQPFQISDKDLLRDKRYDIRAKSGEPTSLAQMRLMLQTLLTARFKLIAHREPKTTSVFELVIAKGGPKLPPNKAAQLPASYARENLPRVVDGGFSFMNITLSEFAGQLSQLRPIARPVLNRTNIEGVYDIALKGAAQAMLQPDGTSLFTLLQEQLGLRLVSAKDDTPMLVVDHVEEPSQN